MKNKSLNDYEAKASVYQKETFKILAETNAFIKNGHFVYQAGYHCRDYVAKDRITLNPLAIDEVGRMLADLIKDYDIDTVAVPAIGGVVLGHVVAKYLSHFKNKLINSIFVERVGKKNKNNIYKYEVTRCHGEYVYGKNVAVLEDIMNSGATVKNVITSVENAGGKVTTVGVVRNRGGLKAKDFGSNITLTNLSVINLEIYDPDNCPLCVSKIPINIIYGHGKEFLENKKK